MESSGKKRVLPTLNMKYNGHTVVLNMKKGSFRGWELMRGWYLSGENCRKD